MEIAKVNDKNILFVPACFDAAAILQNEKGNVTIKRSFTDAMHYILHAIIQQEYRKDQQNELDETGYVFLNATILKSICGHRYAEAAQILEKHGIIAINQSYQPERNSKGYCLVGKYAAAETKVVKLSENGLTRKRYLDRKDLYDKENDDKLYEISYIKKWFDKDRLQVDVNDAHDFLEFYRFGLTKLIPATGDSKLRKKIQNRINQRYNAALHIVKSNIAGDFNLSRMGKDNRLHSSISGLMKEFRGFLKYDGEPLIGIDVKASQPYLFTQLLKRSTYAGEGAIEKNFLIYPTLSNTLQHPNILSRIIMLLTFDTPGIQTSNFGFEAIDWTRDFYSEVINYETKVFPNSLRRFTNRASVKRAIMLILYMKKGIKYKMPDWQRFEALFPFEANIVRFYDGLSRLEGGDFLPIFLQRLESNLILDKVCREIASQMPDAPMITIHDSIMTTPAYVDQMENVIKQQLTLLTGIEPGLKRETNRGQDVLDDLGDTIKADYDEILKKITSKTVVHTVHAKEPLLKKTPRWKGGEIVSTNYLDRDHYKDFY
jgi:hypothetical protein